LKSFGTSLPLLTTNKWKIGHGASGILSMELAILMMQHNTFIGVPFAEAQNKRNQLESIDQCSFGGNAVSVLLSL
jgi:hypothetical protein